MKWKRITVEELDAKIAKTSHPPKWVLFCIELMGEGYLLKMHESETTPSRYILVVKGNKVKQVRFSGHPQSPAQRQKNSCINVSDIGTTEALKQIREYFRERQ